MIAACRQAGMGLRAQSLIHRQPGRGREGERQRDIEMERDRLTGRTRETDTLRVSETDRQTDRQTAFEISKSTLSDTPPPTRPHLLILPKWFHSQAAKCSNI